MTAPRRFLKNRGDRLTTVLMVTQAVCAAFFLWDIASTVFGFRTAAISWRSREILEIAACVGLVLGAVLGFRVVSQARDRVARAEVALRTASGAFADVIEAQFSNWGLTGAETDVAWFSLKGFSSAEIANLRGTSEGTVKAQTNAIYRKAGVNGKAQLLALFVEDLLNVEQAPDEAPRQVASEV